MGYRGGSFSCLTVILLAVGACSIDGDDVRRHAKGWADLQLKDYVFVWFQGCFCDIPDIDGIRVVVRDGVARSAIGVGTGLPVFSHATTMDEIFDRAAKAADENPDEFHVEYDEDNRIIRSVDVDPETGTEDDGFSLEVRCFSRDVDAGCPYRTRTLDTCEEASGTPTDPNRDSPSDTCGSNFPGAIGQIEGSVQVCCSKTN